MHFLRQLFAGLTLGLAVGVAAPAALAAPDTGSTVQQAASSAELERSLQQLSWHDFRAVISAIPKLKADVDAYGAFGWDYVKANFRSYRWAKKIDRLDPEQKQELASLIEKVRSTPASRP